MNGRNGDGLMVQQERLTTPERTRIASEAQMERFLDDLAGRLGGRLEVVVREQVSKEVVPQIIEFRVSNVNGCSPFEPRKPGT